MHDEVKKLYDRIKADLNKARLMRISSSNINIGNTDSIKPTHYNICSQCFSVINNTWDHTDWCVLYQQEPLAKWLDNGKENK